MQPFLLPQLSLLLALVPAVQPVGSLALSTPAGRSARATLTPNKCPEREVVRWLEMEPKQEGEGGTAQRTQDPP